MTESMVSIFVNAARFTGSAVAQAGMCRQRLKSNSRPALRLILPLLLCTTLAGCSLFSSKPDNRRASIRSYEAPAVDRGYLCRGNPDSCAYEGNYEPGEWRFAQQEAKRLNEAELERLKRIRLR